MRTSPAGVAFIERQEGVVLRAYRDATGTLTIGAGLTAASGVVVPRPGMKITEAEASALLAEALRRNYEPRVVRAMAGGAVPLQREFDAAVSFDFNTGAIHEASWVGAWKRRDWPEVRRRFALWNKSGGRVLPGLVRRRAEELAVMEHGHYGVAAPARPAAPTGVAAVLALPVSAADLPEIRAGLARLGHDPGPDPRVVLRRAVEEFQRAHGLTVDGICGRATRETLHRALAARAAAVAPGGAVVAAPAATAAGADDAAGVPWLGEAVTVVALLWCAWTLWRYRDVMAAAIAPVLPRLAARLGRM